MADVLDSLRRTPELPAQVLSGEAVSEGVALHLPADLPWNGGERPDPASFEFTLPAPPLDAAAAFAIQLARYSGQERVPLLVARRPGARAGDIRRVQLDTAPERPLGAVLDELSQQLAASGVAPPPHAVAPVEAAVELLEAGAEPTDALVAASLRLVVRASAAGASGAAARFDFDRSRFTPEAIARFASHLHELTRQLQTDPATALRDAPLLPAAEAAALRASGIGPAVAYPDGPVHRHVERHAARTPEAVALRCNDETLTYGELNARANRLARHLRTMGVGAEGRVMVCADPSFDVVVALLAIHKAGGVYVPLDPGYPAARVQVLLEETAPQVIVARRALVERLRLPSHLVVSPDADAEAIARQPAEDLDVAVAPCDGAYVFFTSGTTGRPKGVLATHANLAQYLFSAQERFGYHAGDVIPAIARFSFSISLLELLSPLLAGGTLVLLEREHVLDVRRLAQTLAGVTCFHAGPSLLRNLLAHVESTAADFSAFAGVRHASSGGDMVPPEVLESLKRVFANAEVFVVYGSTEVACMGCMHAVPRDRVVTRTLVGRPFPNVEVRVLDPARRPVPFGITGEVYFAGAGVTREYLGRPDATAAAYVEVDGRRFYRTGDMGRLHPGGELELLGRRDFQVKVRGIRIELGEVDYQLRRAPGVRDAVAAARPCAGGEPLLVGYLVRASADPATPHETDWEHAQRVRRHLLDVLPEYMVPSHFVHLDALPLNVNLKVDRLALPAPELQAPRGQADRPVRLPVTPVEQRLAAIWAELLGHSPIGLDDDFFALGGDSLRLMQAVNRARTEVGLDAPLSALFDGATLESWAALAARSAPGGAVAPGLARVPVATGPAAECRATATQRALWFLHRLDPASPAYNIPMAFRLRGAIDATALHAALRALVARHGILRTVFAERGGALVQVIGDGDAVDWMHTIAEAAADVGAACRDVAARVAGEPFDLERGPLLRARLVRFAPDDHLLVLSVHHIVADQLGVAQCCRELELLYGDLRAGREPTLDPPALQFADYARWVEERRRDPADAGRVARWADRLRGFSGVLDLPLDAPRPAVQATGGAEHRFTLGPALGPSARAFARREGVSLFVVLLGALQVLLREYCGQDEVIVGTPFANRHEAEALEQVVGCFINTLPIAARPAAADSFRTFVHAVRAIVREALELQAVPLESIVAAAAPRRDPSLNPLFQVGFVLQDPPCTLALAGLASEVLPVHNGGAMYDLHFCLWEAGEAIEGAVWYATSLFQPATIERMVGHYATLLEAFLAAPDTPIGAARLCSPEELRQLDAWNATARTWPEAASVMDLVSAQARATPGAIAVAGGERRLTYEELLARSGRLAAHLQSLGAAPGMRVGVAVGRDADLPVALLGILRTGAAYVPVDPGYPAERVRFMLDAGGIGLLLTQRDALARLPAFDGQVVCLDDWEAIARAPEVPAPVTHGPAGLMYVIFTSGSTGVPKGVQVTHANVINMLRGMAERPGLAPGEALLAVTTLSFDIAVLELFLPLVVGGTVVVAPAEAVGDGQRLRELIEAHDVTTMQATPATWRLLLAAGWTGGPRFRALVGGEALPADLAPALARTVGQAWNMYGPTETTVWSTCAAVTADGPIRIGSPIANTTCHVCNAAGTPLPVGVPGELLIGGDGVTPGYLGRDDLTAERYVEGPAASGRCYRTGDRVRRHPDGALEYLSRLDGQVKVRGFRIEVGEVEAVLARHAAVAEAAVLARAFGPADVRLVAYVRRAPQASLSATELRQHARRWLPDYMVPSVITEVDALPRTPNGKLDRRALPDPLGAAERHGTVVAPRTERERLLAGICARALGTPAVSMTANFFDAGGHSLLAVQVLAELEAATGVRLHPRDLILLTLEQVAARLPEPAAAGTSPAAPGDGASGWRDRLRGMLRRR